MQLPNRLFDFDFQSQNDLSIARARRKKRAEFDCNRIPLKGQFLYISSSTKVRQYCAVNWALLLARFLYRLVWSNNGNMKTKTRWKKKMLYIVDAFELSARLTNTSDAIYSVDELRNRHNRQNSGLRGYKCLCMYMCHIHALYPRFVVYFLLCLRIGLDHFSNILH